MHNAQNAKATLDLLWNNYLLLCEQVDLDVMSPDLVEELDKENSPLRPYRLAAWLARHGCFIATWILWEAYAKTCCDSLPNTRTRGNRQSIVDWVKECLDANDLPFDDYDWFRGANALRNLIAHEGARVNQRSERMYEKCINLAFSDLERFQDGYVDVQHSHVAELEMKIEDFIEATRSIDFKQCNERHFTTR